MNRRPLQLALREMHEASTSRYQRLAMFLATMLLAVSGPFGTFESFNLGQRLAYWACTVVACYLIGQGAATFFIEILRPQIAQKWPRVIIAGLITSLPVTVVVLLINGIAYQHIAVAESVTIWLYVTVVTLIVVITLVTIDELMAGAHAQEEAILAAAAPVSTPPPAVARTSPPRILQRVPPRQRGQLLALIVEDHYVDIVTDKGKALVLMRLADAIGETDGAAGLQIHRSHWVATDAVVKSHRVDGKLFLELSNGMRLPVSRGYLTAVKDLGLG